jgi:hypothetical protein
MKNVWSKVWNSVKLFPFSSYAIVITMTESILAVMQADSKSEISILLILLILPIHLLVSSSSNAKRFFEIISSVWLFLLFFFLLDLLTLYLRKCLIPAIRSKNKNLLIPNFLKSLLKLRNGKS